jgi:peptide/nickel transport system ATP-binding protein
LKAVDGVSFVVEKGQIMGLVGESACGKTTVALATMRLLPPAAKIMGGRILFHGEDLLEKTEDEMIQIRWAKISIIFQGALNSLNPVLPVREQIAEAMLAHKTLPAANVDQAIDRVLEAVRLDPDRKNNYPHELSGGMKQRVMIAMALACNPEIVIADEPTTALDVIVQRQVLELIRSLRDELQLALILITHDLSVVAELCDKVAIMYAGKIVEVGDIYSVFEGPKHPYTQGLLRSLPKMDEKKVEISYIPGYVPDLTGTLPACRFHGQCPYAKQICADQEPQLDTVRPGHQVSCHFWKEIEQS